MSLFYLFLLALVQGLTEFLPVSSSAHLELLHKYSGQSPDDLALDVAVHIGTLGAVVLYFWKDVCNAALGIPSMLKWDLENPNALLALCLIVATVPVVIAGLIMKITGLDEAVRSLAVIGWAMIVFGLLLWWMDKRAVQEKSIENWSLSDAIKLGIWQAVALLPGTSRSGITITGALKMGFNRQDAARISMLMSIPTILASGTLLGLDAIGSGNTALIKPAMIAAGFAFVAAFVALAVMMRLLRFMTFTPYVIYRVILGTVLLWIAYT